jgi:hypothetical protein
LGQVRSGRFSSAGSGHFAPTLVALTASLVEMFAGRLSERLPGWTAAVGPNPVPVYLVPVYLVPVYLVPSAHRMKNLKRLCESEGPLEL